MFSKTYSSYSFITFYFCLKLPHIPFKKNVDPTPSKNVVIVPWERIYALNSSCRQCPVKFLPYKHQIRNFSQLYRDYITTRAHNMGVVVSYI